MINELLAPLARDGKLDSRPKYPDFPLVFEPSALYLALALTAQQKRCELIAPKIVLKRLAELGWLRSLSVRPGCDHGLGWLDLSTARFLGISGIACFLEHRKATSLISDVAEWESSGEKKRISDVDAWAERVIAIQLPAPGEPS